MLPCRTASAHQPVRAARRQSLSCVGSEPRIAVYEASPTGGWAGLEGEQQLGSSIRFWRHLHGRDISEKGPLTQFSGLSAECC